MVLFPLGTFSLSELFGDLKVWKQFHTCSNMTSGNQTDRLHNPGDRASLGRSVEPGWLPRCVDNRHRLVIYVKVLCILTGFTRPSSQAEEAGWPLSCGVFPVEIETASPGLKSAEVQTNLFV